MSIGDIYQLRMNINHPAELECLNIFYYRILTETAVITAEDVSDAFLSDIVPDLFAALVNTMELNLLTVINGMDNSDFFESNPSVNGTGGAISPCSPNLALGFRSQRNGPGTRRSYKRVVGYPFSATDTTNGRFTIAYQSDIETAAAVFDDGLAVPNGTLIPVQLGGGFRLGVTPIENFDLLGEWEFDVFPTHQDTRQAYLWLTNAQT